jgi:hypothetical protein
VLPTLIVICCAYAVYVLCAYVLQRRTSHARHRRGSRKVTWLTLGCSLIGLALILWFGFTPDRHDQRLSLAGFLGTVYAEGWPHQVAQTEYPPVKIQTSGAGEQPAYALLHPETPTSQLAQEKKLIKPRPVRAAKKKQAPAVQEKSGKTVKVTKAPVPSSKKDKLAVKGRTKKLKRSSAKGSRQTDAG